MPGSVPGTRTPGVGWGGGGENTGSLLGTPLVVQGLGLRAPNAGGPGSIPGWGVGAYIPHLSPTAANKQTNTEN